MCKINKNGQKNTFELRKCAPNVIFPRFRGVFGLKSSLGFSFRGLEVPFLVPPKSHIVRKLYIIGCLGGFVSDATHSHNIQSLAA